MTLLADVNHLGSQEDEVSNCEPAHSLVEDVISGAEIAAAPCLLPLAVSRLPLCLRGGRALCGSWLALLWYLLNRLFCERARGADRAFREKGLFLCVSLAIPRFGLLSHISSLRLSSGHSGLVLTLRTSYAGCASLPSPHSLVVDPSVWATSPLAVVLRCVFCGVFFFFFFPSWLCCPLRFQNSPQTLLCEGFLLCGDFSSFLTPSPGWVSVPKSFL